MTILNFTYFIFDFPVYFDENNKMIVVRIQVIHAASFVRLWSLACIGQLHFLPPDCEHASSLSLLRQIPVDKMSKTLVGD